MLHCPRNNIMRTVAYSGFFLATCFAPALAADPTGDWRVADGVANIRVAECNGSMWGVVAWEKTPGGRDKNNPDVSKQNRPTLGMPILIDMKKKPGVDQWEGQVYNAKDGQLCSSTITPSGIDQLEIKGCVLGFLCGGRALAQGREEDGRRSGGRSRWRYLPTRRYRGVFPLAPAGTRAPQEA